MTEVLSGHHLAAAPGNPAPGPEAQPAARGAEGAAPA
eukprot:CAMPEP_0118948808 /NCGR_PEP_ID=MMETSP1169-20130426/48494_1 /TAXON_ID=36882 /ORGANISM="Pyramimonas obovata, Strain CCMP722" /LENGTH=36 /DNA_ID= /DNA_START= /DNA_END= /DNA_ORIENTATION=